MWTLLREAIKTKTVTYNWHDSDTSFLEAVLARGDRRLGKVLETAWRKGAKLDAWERVFLPGPLAGGLSTSAALTRISTPTAPVRRTS